MRFRVAATGLAVGAVAAMLIVHVSAPATLTMASSGRDEVKASAPSKPPERKRQLPTGKPTSCAAAAAATLDQAAQAKQVFMVGTSAVTGRQGLAAQRGVGGFILTGRSSAGVSATARFTATLTSDPSPIRPLVATDQEGGAVQALNGPGFSGIPSAEEQGTWPSGHLLESARQWGAELAKAGVSMDLAPVVDVVPADRLRTNKPIGAVHRQLGSDPGPVVRAAKAVSSGLRDAGIAVVYKHFPGLGMVTGNTDYSRQVTDSITRADSASVDIYRQLLATGGASIMISTAIYSQLDARQPAAFSQAIVTHLLRESMKFNGVVISDDLANAEQIQGIPAKDRAVRFLAAGGDLVIAADPRIAEAMYGRVLATATADPAFALRLRESAQRVLTLKVSLGLLDCQALTR